LQGVCVEIPLSLWVWGSVGNACQVGLAAVSPPIGTADA
jgi:hypothetical protein